MYIIIQGQINQFKSQNLSNTLYNKSHHPNMYVVLYSTRHRNVTVLESYNGRRTEETLQSVGRFLATSRRLHYRSKDVPFLRTVAPFSIKR